MTLAVAEMYVQGVSTRKVTKIVEELCGLQVNSTQVSRAAAELDEELAAWRNRPLSEIAYLILDARYEKVRHGGAVVPCAVLTAVGITPDGKRPVLGCSVARSEAETHWRGFLEVFAFPAAHRKRLRTNNGLERVNKEIKRRARVATLFPNEASVLRFVSAVLSEISDDWETQRPCDSRATPRRPSGHAIAKSPAPSMSPPANQSGTVSPSTPGAALHGQPHTHKVPRRTGIRRSTRPTRVFRVLGLNPLA
jgi:transposase-like protein